VPVLRKEFVSWEVNRESGFLDILAVEIPFAVSVNP
jgi:hypothetical protein